MNALWEDDTVIKLSNELPKSCLPNQTTRDRIREVLTGCFVLAKVSSVTFGKSLSLSCHNLAEEEMRIINSFPHLLVLEQTLNGKYCRFQMSRWHCHLLQRQESSVVIRNNVSPREA